MKTYLKILIVACLLVSQASQAQSDADKPVIVQRNSTDTAYLNRILPIPAAGANGIFYFDGSTVRPRIMTLGTNLSIVADVLNASSTAQVNSDWNSVSGVSQVLNKPTLFDGAYASLSGKPTLFSGIYADLTGKPSLFSGIYSDLTGKPTLFSGAYTDLTGKPTLATVATSGAYADLSSPPSLSAVATSGSYTDLSNKPTITSGTVTSVTAGAGLSGGVITTTGTVSMPNTGTAGTYSGVTTDAQGRVTSGTTLSINDAPGRALVTSTSSTGFQVSSTRPAYICYEGVMQTTSTIGGPSSGSIFIETANTNSTTPGDWTKIAEQTSSNTLTLAIILQNVDGEPWSLCRMVAAAKYVRVRSQVNNGTVSFSINATQQEVQM